MVEVFKKAPPNGIMDVEDWADSMFSDLDTDRSGGLEFTEWKAAALRNFRHTEESLKAAFHVLDKSCTDTITADDLARFINATKEDVVEWMKEFDGDGELDFDEFKELFKVRCKRSDRDGLYGTVSSP